MVHTKEDFGARLNHVEKKQSRLLRRGYTTHVGRNGIIVAKPKRARINLPVKGILLFVLGFFCLKALMLYSNGPETYNDRLVTLQNGNFVEAIGARIMAIDPLTQLITDQVGQLL